MTTPMARQEGHLDTVQTAGQDSIRWRAPRAFAVDPGGLLQPVHIVDARTADNSDFRLHDLPCRNPRPHIETYLPERKARVAVLMLQHPADGQV